MTDQFAFLGDNCKAAIAAMSLGVLSLLLLLPASLGYGGTIIQEAFGQLTPPPAPLDGGEEVGGGEEEATLPASASRFQLTESGGNGTNTTTATGSVPPVSSNLTTRIYVDGNTPIIDNVPMTISIRGQVLAIEGIDIDETSITDTGQRDILSIIDGQSIYGIVSR